MGKKEERVLRLLAPEFISGLSVLGGEPFEPEKRAVLAPFQERVRLGIPAQGRLALDGLHAGGAGGRRVKVDAGQLRRACGWSVRRGDARHHACLARLPEPVSHPPRRTESKATVNPFGWFVETALFRGLLHWRGSHAEADRVVASRWTSSLSAEGRLAGPHFGVPGAAAVGVDWPPPFRSVRGGYGGGCPFPAVVAQVHIPVWALSGRESVHWRRVATCGRQASEQVRVDESRPGLVVSPAPDAAGCAE